MLKTRAGVLVRAPSRAQPLHLCHWPLKRQASGSNRPRAVRSVLDGKTCACQPGLLERVELGRCPVRLASGCRHSAAWQLLHSSALLSTPPEASGCAVRRPPHLSTRSSLCAVPAPSHSRVLPPDLVHLCPRSQVHLLSAAQTKLKLANKTTLSKPPVQLLVVTLSRSSEVHPSFSHVSLLLYPRVSPDQPRDPLEQVGPPPLACPVLCAPPEEASLHSAPSSCCRLELTPFFGLWEKHPRVICFQEHQLWSLLPNTYS